MKLLIISHNPMSTYNNMGRTLCGLFNRFSKEELCQLYIYPSVPDVDRCGSYYRITDKDVLKAYALLKVRGKEVKPELENHNLFDTIRDAKLYGNRKNKKPFRMLARDIMWNFSAWYNKDLKGWLDKEKPDKIFIAPGEAKFIYNMAIKISKKYNIPIVTYICDDYYFIKKPKTLLARVCWQSLRKTINKLMLCTSQVVAICDDINKTYSKYFSVPATTIMTNTSYDIVNDISVSRKPQTLKYMGNIGCNRYSSLAEIGMALDEINSDQGTNYQFKIYSGESDEKIISHFDGIDSIEYCGFISGEEYKKVFYSSDILLHVEAFDSKSIDTVKYSVSTKIADILSSGIPLLAYGPAEVASMKHLIDNGCAVTACTKEELKQKLIAMLANPEQCEQLAIKGLEIAEKLHNPLQNGEKMKSLFS